MSKKLIQINCTYKYRLHENSKANRRLHDIINVSGIIWNHITALRKRYYRLYSKHLPSGQLQKYISKLRMKRSYFVHWQMVGSQALQDICQRHDKAYERFFNKKGGLPRFKKVKKYTSFTLKQTGWKLGADKSKRGSKKHPKCTGHITILGHRYQFVKHRPLGGVVKTVTIKRDSVGRLWVCFSVVEKIEIGSETSTGQIGGFDFGLQMFLTSDTGDSVPSPQFFNQDLPRLRIIQRQLSKKVTGSTNQRNGKQHIARRHIRIADKRQDFHFQLAHDLFDRYDVVVFEDLNLDGMKRLWGKKVSDLGFGKFVDIVKWVAVKRGKRVILIDRWQPTTQTCSGCHHRQKMALKDRIFCCERCGLNLDRDHNAAKNILEAGHRLMLSQPEEVPVKGRASGVNVRSPRL